MPVWAFLLQWQKLWRCHLAPGAVKSLLIHSNVPLMCWCGWTARAHNPSRGQTFPVCLQLLNKRQTSAGSEWDWQMVEGSVPCRRESATAVTDSSWCGCAVQDALMLPQTCQAPCLPSRHWRQVEKEPVFSCQRLQGSGLAHLASLHSPLQPLQTLFLCSWEFRLLSLQGLSDDAINLSLSSLMQCSPLTSCSSTWWHSSSANTQLLQAGTLPLLAPALSRGPKLSWQLDTWKAASSLRSSAQVKASEVPAVVSSADAKRWHPVACYHLVWALARSLQQCFCPLYVDCALELVVA